MLRILLIMLLGLISHGLYGFDMYIIGDSHACFCFNNTVPACPTNVNFVFEYSKDSFTYRMPFHINSFVSRTMFRVGRDGLRGLDIRALGVCENDVAVFTFGEIDVRYHIGRQRDKQGRSTEEIIDSLVSAYIGTIQANKNNYTNVTCVIVSVLPPCDKGFSYEYPIYGSLQDRVAITRAVNERLKSYSQLHGIYFLDIYSMYALENGALNESLSDGIVHVNQHQNTPIKEALVELIMCVRPV
ncbi:MAG: SGNH/GDSL hydrolase family protein [Candidatus Dependentiae bacterium]|nr:SGNH/GDSL hydrolase family protein [Candidatus Dependentiae bacterium]